MVRNEEPLIIHPDSPRNYTNVFEITYIESYHARLHRWVPGAGSRQIRHTLSNQRFLDSQQLDIRPTVLYRSEEDVAILPARFDFRCSDLDNVWSNVHNSRVSIFAVEWTIHGWVVTIRRTVSSLMTPDDLTVNSW